MTDRLKEELELDHVFSNELLFNDGKLDGVKINVDSDKSKSANIKIAEWNEKKDDITVIVDGANDVKLFDISDDMSWKSYKNYTFRHLLNRIEIYNSEKFDYNIKKIPLYPTVP